MQVNALTREFRYNGVRLDDPNPAFTLPQVRDFYATVYPEIINADIEGPEAVGASNVYTFRRAVGTKGTHPLTRKAALERLRTCGHLGTHKLAASEIPAAALDSPLTRQLDRIFNSRFRSGTPMLAPSSCHVVLP